MLQRVEAKKKTQRTANQNNKFCASLLYFFFDINSILLLWIEVCYYVCWLLLTQAHTHDMPLWPVFFFFLQLSCVNVMTIEEINHIGNEEKKTRLKPASIKSHENVVKLQHCMPSNWNCGFVTEKKNNQQRWWRMESIWTSIYSFSA